MTNKTTNMLAGVKGSKKKNRARDENNLVFSNQNDYFMNILTKAVYR